ncbi:MAG: hypothetical protein P8Y68_17415 [Anaerolineales bacterium]|jgi:hypothetical protein
MLANIPGFSKVHLNAIATRALIDEDFKAGILNGSRGQKIGEYPLPEITRQEIMNIHAADVSQFIQGLYMILTNQADQGFARSRD